MIKKFFVTLIIFLISMSLILYFLENIKSRPENIVKDISRSMNLKQGNLFDKGRVFTLKINYMGFLPVGTASFMVEDKINFEQTSAYRLFASARLSDFLSKLYFVKPEIFSIMDVKNLNSLKYTEKIITKDETKVKEILYDQKEHIAQRGDMKIKILPDTQDPLSAIFCLLSQKYEIGKSFSLNILTKEENYEFKVDVLGKVNKIWQLKVFVGRQDRSSAHGGTFYFWVYEDNYKIPLSISAWTQAGLITARLIEIM